MNVDQDHSVKALKASCSGVVYSSYDKKRQSYNYWILVAKVKLPIGSVLAYVLIEEGLVLETLECQ